MEPSGKLALVTGAGIRLGRALSEVLADAGMRLALHYHQHESEARALARSIEVRRRPEAGVPGGESGGETAEPQAGCFHADLNVPASIPALLEEVEANMGPLEALILSAAVYPRAPVEQITLASFETTLRINLTSPFLLAQAAGLRMKARGRGVIIALLDWSMDRPYPDRIPYTMAKAGLRTGVIGLARALAPEVRVNAIAPGAVLLPELTDPETREKILAATPLQRIGTPDDVAQAALFLLRSEFITGSVLTVDGGRGTH